MSSLTYKLKYIVLDQRILPSHRWKVIKNNKHYTREYLVYNDARDKEYRVNDWPFGPGAPSYKLLENIPHLSAR